MASEIPDFRLINSDYYHRAFLDVLQPFLQAPRRNIKVFKEYFTWSKSTRLMFFRFLDLPAEIRHLIYHCLFDGAVLGVHHGYLKLSSSNASGTILRTCRLIHRESLPILHSLTTVRYTGAFHVSSPKDLPLAKKHLIQRVAISSFIHHGVDLTHNKLRAYHSLQVLHIEMFHAIIHSHQHESLPSIRQQPGPRDDFLTVELKSTRLWTNYSDLKGPVGRNQLWDYIHDGRRTEDIELGVSLTIKHLGGADIELFVLLDWERGIIRKIPGIDVDGVH